MSPDPLHDPVQPGRHIFDNGVGESFLVRCQKRHVGRGEQRRHVLNGAEPVDVLGQSEIFGGLLQEGADTVIPARAKQDRSEEHTSELQSLMRISYAVFCLKKKTNLESTHITNTTTTTPKPKKTHTHN